MNYPSINEYKEAILFAEENFEQLKHLRPVVDDDGQPVMSSGNFAVVFKMKDEQTGKLHAVKCFLREQEGRAEAYRQIAEELEYVSSTFLTPIRYLDKELFVDSSNSDESEFPVLLMDWVEGQTLDKYIREHIDDQYELSLLAYQFSRLAMWLMPQPFAHGDLKPDNILAKEDGTLALVDYDGMYVPAMKGQKARELGSPDFRHPSRTEDDFDEHIDDFSLVSILLSLKAISLQPELLEQYGASDRLLFSERDYRNLSESQVMDTIKGMMQDTELATLYSLFILSSAQNNLSQASFRLLNLSRPKEPEHENLSTEVTEEDLANAWTDEYGVKYSADRKRLLEAPEEIVNYIVLYGTKVICNEAFYKTDVCLRFSKNAFLGEVEEEEILFVSKLESITLPTTIRVIGDSAFAECKLLTSINIPNRLKSLGKSVFEGCTKLEKVVFSGENIDIGEYAFNNCTKLSSIIIPNGVKVIERGLFKGCKNLVSVTIPNSVEKIKESAFYWCTNLPSIIIPDSVTEIGDHSFNRCSKLERVTLSKNIISIGKSSFCLCKSLNSIFIPSSVKEIKEYAFKHCSSLNSIIVERDNSYYDSRNNCNAIIETTTQTLIVACSSTNIPDGIHIIGNESFYSLKELANVIIPNSVEIIGECAFAYCEKLSSITIPNSVNKICDAAFYGCKSLSFATIENSNITLGERTFHECWSLTKLYIPHKAIDRLLLYDYGDKYAEENDLGLSLFALKTEVTEKDLANAWVDEYGVQYSIDRKRLLSAPAELSNYSIREETVVICNHAFGGCKNMSSITFSNNVRVIGFCSFEGCSSLNHLVIPYGTIKIGNSAFWKCSGLTEIHLPNTLKSIGNSVFSSCTSLTSIKLPSSITRISDFAFSGCYQLIELTLPDSITEIGDSCFESCRKISSISIPGSVSTIGDYAFAFCESLSSIALNNGIKHIGGCVFYKCNSMRSACIPNTVTSFGRIDPNWGHEGVCKARATTFDGIDSLQSIFIPKDTRKKYEDLLSYYKDKLIEFDLESFSGWHVKTVRLLSIQEIKAINSAVVVNTQEGLSVCLNMIVGGQTYVSLSKQSKLTVGDELDIRTAKLITLSRKGESDITRVIE